jgi:hypothetical protein
LVDLTPIVVPRGISLWVICCVDSPTRDTGAILGTEHGWAPMTPLFCESLL